MNKTTIKEIFNAKGLKLTPQRCAIYEVLARRMDHPTAEGIYRRVKRVHPMISANTVYYTLSALKRAGLISEVNVGHERARFDANMSQHHHLICVGCQEIIDIHDTSLDRVKLSRPPIPPYKILSHRVEFYGLCERCARKRTWASYEGNDN